MIEIGPNLMGVLITLGICGALAVIFWAESRPPRRNRKKDDG